MTIERAEKAIAKDPANAPALAAGASALAVLGEDRQGQRLDRPRACCSIPTTSMMRYNLACALVVRTSKNRERAIEVLGPYFEQIVSPTQIKHLDADPDLDPIRDDPRFKEMLAAAKQRLGMASVARNGASIFLSYAREDADAAGSWRKRSASAGHEVWWDEQIQGGSRFTSAIDQALKNAEAVVVLWSRSSVEIRLGAGRSRRRARQRPAGAGRRSAGPAAARLPPVPVDRLSRWNGRGGRRAARRADRRDREDRRQQGAAGKAAPPEQRRASSKASICVLPFVNMSGDPEQEYFSDGITEDIITDLSKVSALTVIARNTAFNFKGRAVDMKEVAQTLGVSYVLEGSVRKAGDRVRITAQLIDGAAGDHVWADRYDRDLDRHFRDPGRDFEGDRRRARR